MSHNKHNNKMKKFLKSFISIILSFLMSVIFTVMSLVVGIYIGFLNENRIIDGLNYKDYYKGVEKTFFENAKDLSTPIGMPDTVLNDIVVSEKIHSDVKNYVISSVNGKNYTISTDELKIKLAENVREYFAQQNMEMTPEQEATVPEYTQLIADEYLKTVKVPFVNHFSEAKNLVRKIMFIVVPVCLIVSAFIAFILIRMRKWKHRGIRYIVYSTLATALMVALPGVVVLCNGFYKRINIASDYLYYALVKYVANGLWVFVYLAIVWLALSVGLLFLIRFIKSKY